MLANIISLKRIFIQNDNLALAKSVIHKSNENSALFYEVIIKKNKDNFSTLNNNKRFVFVDELFLMD